MNSKIYDLRGLLTALLLCVTLSMAAQTSVKGIVQDKSGEPLIGATVQEKGNTTNGIATGIDGDFAIKVKSPNATLLVSYVGMKSQEVALNGRTDVTVTLEDDAGIAQRGRPQGIGHHQHGSGSSGPRHRCRFDGLFGCSRCRIVNPRAWSGHHQRKRRASLCD